MDMRYYEKNNSIKGDTEDIRQILVIGGGLGGIRTALDIAETGRNVTLIDKAQAIGGLMTQLDRTFPTNNCDLCTVAPTLSASGRELHIDIMPLTQLQSLEGEAGNFAAEIETAPRYIDIDRCTSCGVCAEKYPECVVFKPGLDPRAPTCMRYPQATPFAFAIDMDKCTDVDGLVNACPAMAIIPDDKPKTTTIQADSIVLAPGAELFDYSLLDNYGNGILKNVVSGMEYERIMSASGPTNGLLQRPSDGSQPKKVAWIQCVGSRDINRVDSPYCSSVCCMYALKEAIVTKERFQDDIEATIYYMDMRTFGKDYELYLNRAQNDYNVKLVASRPHSIEVAPGTDDLVLLYTTDEGNMEREEFDMVVLSTGFKIPADLIALAEKLGVELDQNNFAKTSTFDPVATSKNGIYVCGLFESPKDIPETITQASAAACRACEGVGRFVQQNTADELPMERDVRNEDAKIGVFICDCGENIGGVLDVEEIAKYAAGLPGVALAEVVGHGCSSESMERIESRITSEKLNRVVIGGCSPRTHEAKFQDTLRKAGINKHLVDMANLRDQNTWVHVNQPEAAAVKAKEQIRMSINNVVNARPLADFTLPVNKDVLVVGGGVSGMTSAISLADQGFKVFLLEIADKLGGIAAQVRRTIEGDDATAFVESLVKKTMGHENIQVLTRAVVVDHAGMPGMFNTGIQFGPRMQYRSIKHGATILATGALPNKPAEYLLGEHKAVTTQLDFDSVLEDAPESIKELDNFVMVQCVGSRTAENPNCSRVCCLSAIKNALNILDLNPEARVFILYRDIRTYGLYEDYYSEARKRGVIFARYNPETPPRVNASGDIIEVTYKDQIFGRELVIEADRLILSTGLIADDESTEDLARIFHLPRTGDGYFLEDHIKLRPLDLPVKGFFVAGTAHAPKNIGECVTQAQAAAGRAKTLLAKDSISLDGAVAKVNNNTCAACLICVRACPFNVPFINADGYSEIDPAKCHGCGTCASECPAKAIQLMRFEDDQILAELEALLEVIA